MFEVQTEVRIVRMKHFYQEQDGKMEHTNSMVGGGSQDSQLRPVTVFGHDPILWAKCKYFSLKANTDIKHLWQKKKKKATVGNCPLLWLP